MLLGPGLAGAAPRVAYIFPPGGKRGTTVKVTFSGSELGGITGLYSTGKGLTATVEPGASAASCTIDVTIAKDAPLGIQQIRCYGPSGLSNARFFDVGQWPETAAQIGGPPLRITPPVTVNGRIASQSTRNGVEFHARAGETLVCQIQALRMLGQINDSWLKGYLEILDSAGHVMLSSDGTPDDYYRWDPVVAFTAPKEGDYTVWFRDLNWRGAPMAVYRLTVAASPQAFGIFPLGGRRGTSQAVHFFGPFLKDAAKAVVIPADAPDTLEVAYDSPNGATNQRPFHVSDLQDVLQKSGNNSRDSAQSITYPCVVNGRIEKDGLRDYYRFKLDKKEHVVLEAWSRRLGTPMDPQITLFNQENKQVGSDDDSRGRDSRLERDLQPGEYTVCIRDIDERGGIAYPYRLFVAPQQPRFKLVATPDAPVLKPGASTDISVNVERTDGFDGDVAVTVTGLPAGATAASLTIPKGKQDGKLTISTSADALGGLYRLTVSGTGKVGTLELRAIARTSETYNIQGTAFQRDLIGPILMIAPK
jgi:hypothetical protein